MLEKNDEMPQTKQDPFFELMASWFSIPHPACRPSIPLSRLTDYPGLDLQFFS